MRNWTHRRAQERKRSAEEIVAELDGLYDALCAKSEANPKDDVFAQFCASLGNFLRDKVPLSRFWVENTRGWSAKDDAPIDVVRRWLTSARVGALARGIKARVP